MAVDLTEFDDETLEGMRIAILTEQERRQRRQELPATLETMTRAAEAAGVSAEVIRSAVAAGLEPPGKPAPPVDPMTTEQPAPAAAKES